MWGALASALAVLSGSGLASAKPEAPALFCETYPDIPDCSGKAVNCQQCHLSTFPVSWNSYGQSVAAELDGKIPFEEALPDALRAIESEDADEDGTTNLDELKKGTQPGDELSAWTNPDATEGIKNPRYNVDHYDPRFAYRRLSVLYCGQSPSYKELQEFQEDDPDAETLQTRLHEALTACLSSPYWQQEALPRLADKRIKPLQSAGPDSRVVIATMRLVIGDYNYDYRLWRYVLTEDRDMRELLTAQYHVTEDEEGELEKVEGPLEKSDEGALAGGQPLEAERRAGMITTQWFLSINTMFSGLPRTTAAQAYRAYLGADISSNDGIFPVEGEPSNIDNKGVDAEQCASCHSTLDPLAYAFAKYEGIDAQLGGGYGGYNPERVSFTMPDWDDDAQEAVILGQSVDDLPEWAQVAANSDMFKRNMAEVFFHHALSREVGPTDMKEFTTIWQALPDDDYSANRLIHRLVDTHAFGAP